MPVENINITVTTNAAQASRQLHSLSNAVRGVAESARGVASSASGMAKSIAGISSAAHKTNKPLSTFLSSLKRIAFYRFIRSIIKSIVQAFTEGLKNAYNFSKGIDGTLSKALDNLASKSLKMKNQLGAMWGNLLQIAMPVILKLIDLITQLASAISALFSVFGGGQYLVAKDVEQSWDAATGAAKKYKNTILGFDEINRLNDETGGGGGKLVDASDMFELGQLNEELMKFKETIASLWDASAFVSVGSYIADTINNAFNSIDLNTAGETLWKKINSILSVAFGFVENIDLRSITANITSAISIAMEQIDFSHAGAIFASKWTLWWDVLLGIIDGTNWETIGKSIGDFFRGMFDHVSDWLDAVNWEQVGIDIVTAVEDLIVGIDFPSLANSFWNLFVSSVKAASKLVKGLSEALVEWIKNVDWVKVGDEAYKKLKKMFSDLDFSEIAKSVFELLGAAFAAAVEFLASFINDVIEDIKKYFDDKIQEKKDKFGDTGWAILYGILDGIVSAIADIGNWIFENILKPFIDGFKKAFGIASPAKEMEEPGKYVGEGILEGILQPFTNIFQWIKENVVDPLINAAKKAFGIESTNASTIFSDIGKSLVEGLWSGFKEKWDTFVSTVKGWWDGLKGWFSNSKIDLNVSGSVGTKVNSNGYSHYAGTFASGGFPQQGSLFVAGEAGAELVGNIGGRTGVVNTDQMSGAIAQGNSNVVGAVYAMADAIVQAINNKDMDIEMDGESVARILYRPMQQENYRRGDPLVVGGAFA